MTSSLSAQKLPSYSGLYVKLNATALSVSSASEPWRASEQTVPQWSAGAGVFYVSPSWKKLRLELQLGYESIGSGKLFYYSSGTNEWTRIYDRYRTIPASIMLHRNITASGNWYLNAGMKTAWVMNYEVRHDNIFPGPTSGVILSPDVKRIFSSAIAEIGWMRPHGDIVVTGWYSRMPLINDKNTIARPFGVSLTIKAHVFPSRT